MGSHFSSDQRGYDAAGKVWNPVAVVLLVILFIILFTITYLWWETSFRYKTGVRSYFDVVYRCTVIVGILAAIYTIQQNYEKNTNDFKQQIQARLEEGMVRVQRLFMNQKWFNDLQPMYLEMNPSLNHSLHNDTPIDTPIDIPIQSKQSSQSIQIQYMAANVLFRQIEIVFNYLGATQIMEPGYHQWLRTWRMYFSSPLLRRYWFQSAPQYSSLMQNFVENELLSKFHSKPQAEVLEQ